MAAKLKKLPKRVRQRERADGSLRLWWEPDATAKRHGFEAVELDPDRPTWSVQRATQLNADVDRANKGRGAAPRSSGGRSIEALIALYLADEMFTGKKAKTQASYRGFLKIISEKWGAENVVSFSKPVLRKWYQTNCTARGTTMAARLNAMMSILFSFAELEGWRPEGSNPATRIKVGAATRRSRIVSWEEFDACIDAAEGLGYHALAWCCRLSLFQGQRQTDVFQAAPKDFRDVETEAGTRLAWKVLRSKRGTLGMMAVHPEIAPALRQLLAARQGEDVLLIDETLGRPFDDGSFRRRWDAVRDLAARRCPSITASDNPLQFRDLRRSFGVLARAGSASNDDIADVLGNSANQDAMLEDIYMPPSFETASRAVLAIQRPAKTEKRRKA